MSRSPRPQTWARSERGGVGAVQILATLLSHPLLPAHTLFVQSKVVGLGFGNFQGEKIFCFLRRKCFSLPVVGAFQKFC